MIAGSVAGMIGGAAVTESVFNIHGMGSLTVTSLNFRDYPQEQAIVLFTAFLFLFLDLLLDIMYKLLDPRIEYE
jgi:ABC-type dipeptide/oligopeptide/nickel transport system permease component